MSDIPINLSIGGIQDLDALSRSLLATSENMKSLLSNINGLATALDKLEKKSGKSGGGVDPNKVKDSANAVERLKKEIEVLKFQTKDAGLTADQLYHKYYRIGEAKEEINRITNSYKNQAKESARLAREQEKIRANQAKVTAEYANGIGIVKQLESRMALLKQQMQSSTDPTTVKRLNEEIRKLAAEKAKLTGATQNLGNQSRVTMGVLSQFRGVIINAFGAYAAVGAIKSMFNIVKDFESQMARVRAITGATAEEFKLLSQIARNPSIKGSIFDPKTIGELQVELAKLGFTAREIGLATVPIINLATATGEDLARAAEVAAATLRSFNLDATEMPRVIDVMAKSFNVSALDMSRWAEAAKYAAPVANTLGWNVEQLGAAMSVLANRQVFGSLAGTSLRNIMSEISDQSSTLYQRLGLTNTSFGEFISKLADANERGLGFSEILELVPRRASTAFLVLARNTQELRQLEMQLIRSAGAIEQMADIQLTTLKSEIAKTSTAWKSLILEIEEGDGVFSQVAKGGLKLLSDGLRDLTLQMQYGSFQKAILNWLNPTTFGWVYNDFKGLTDKIVESAKKDIDEYNKLLNDFSEDIATKKISGSLEDRYNFFMEMFDRYMFVYEETLKGLDGAELAAAKKRAEKYREILNSSFGVYSSELSRRSQEENLKRLNEIQNLVKEGQKTVFNLERALNTNMDIFPSGATRDEVESELESARTSISFLEIEAKQINDIISRQIKAREDEDKERLKRIKSALSLEYQIKKNNIEADQSLDETQRKISLAQVESWYKVKLANLERSESDSLEIKKLYSQLIESEEKRLVAELKSITDKANEDKIKDAYRMSEKTIRQQKRVNDMEVSLMQVNLDTLKKKLNETLPSDKKARRSIVDDILGLEYEIEIKKAQNNIDDLTRKIESINKALEGLEGEDRVKMLNVLGIDEESIAEIENQLRLALLRIGLIVKENQPAEKKTLADILGIDDRDFELLKKGFKEVESSIKSMTDTAVASAKARADESKRRVSELEQALQTELQLAEQGFASNVSLRRKELEEEKKIRDAAIQDQKKAQRAQLALQSVMDAANIASTVIQLALTQVKTKGLAGIIATAVGAASLLALISNIRAKSKEITSYEKGGFEYLEGKSHRQGGIPLGEGREAQGGEMLAVFNRKATSKYGKEIESFVNALNKDKININHSAFKQTGSNVIVNVDNSRLDDIHGVLKDVRDNNITFSGNYKIVRNGNRTRRVRLNGI